MQRLLWICLAGGLGSGARYLVGVWAGAKFGTEFPYGTLIVNVLGCFCVALVMTLALSIASFPSNLRYVLATGFLGGFTTYSSFNYETTKLLEQSAYTAAFLNLGITVVGCFVAGLMGVASARWLFGA